MAVSNATPSRRRASPAARPVVDVRTRGIRRMVDPRTIKRRAVKLLCRLQLEHAELSVLLCTDEQITELNSEYRGIDRATDVLSFPLDDEEGAPDGRRMLGDIVISVETARTQARRRQHPLLDELTFLLVHGLLHLLGHDHQTRKDAARMNHLAAELLEDLRSRRSAVDRPTVS